MGDYSRVVLVADEPRTVRAMLPELNEWLAANGYCGHFVTVDDSPCAWATLNYLNREAFDAHINTLKWTDPWTGDKETWHIMVKGEWFDRYSEI